MRIAPTTAAAMLLMGLVAHAQAPAPGQTPVPAPQQPVPTSPAPQQPPPVGTAPAVPGPVVPAPVVPPVSLGARTFTARTGMIFNAVRPERVVDFEMVIGYLQAAFDKSTDAEVRAQAQGWRVFKATEPGPNGTALYVFVIDPTVADADYGLGRILSDAYPDQIQSIWKLYTGALAGGGSLLNLTPVEPPPLPPPGAPMLITPDPTPRPAPPAR
ncbi:MAG: hypothetical protein HYX77_02820 [Acidobacteria bacterium]|nr:hypothetical protein [Acidobacteriota bacterium]